MTLLPPIHLTPPPIPSWPPPPKFFFFVQTDLYKQVNKYRKPNILANPMAYTKHKGIIYTHIYIYIHIYQAAIHKSSSFHPINNNFTSPPTQGQQTLSQLTFKTRMYNFFHQTLQKNWKWFKVLKTVVNVQCCQGSYHHLVDCFEDVALQNSWKEKTHMVVFLPRSYLPITSW